MNNTNNGQCLHLTGCLAVWLAVHEASHCLTHKHVGDSASAVGVAPGPPAH